MSTRNTIVAALLLFSGAGLMVAACSSHTESEYQAHGEERCKTCGEAQCEACGEAQRKISEEVGKKKGRQELESEFRRWLEPHPQSPYYRGKELERYVRVAGGVDKGTIRGASKSGKSEVIAYDSAGEATKLFVEEKGSDPCIKDAKLKPVGAPPPMYIVTDATERSLCNEEYPKADGDRLKCDLDHDTIQNKALALPGYWDANGRYIDDGTSFTLACISGVAAKCAHWGYAPWEKYKKAGSAESTDLLPYYKACVHAARADYKGEGDGSFHTCSSTEFDIYDNLGIADPHPEAGWEFEAAWSQRGAVCAARPRYDLSSVGKECLDGYPASANCAQRCSPGADTSVLVCNRVRAGLKVPSRENICPGSASKGCSCNPLGCTVQSSGI